MAQALIARRTVACLALIYALPFPGIAAQRFRFSGLSWGESLDASKAKLTEAGYTLGDLFTYSGRTGGFSLSFTGTIGSLLFRGSAQFFESKLINVVLEFPLDPRGRHEQIAAIEDMVQRRYGKGRRGKISDGRDRTRTIWGQEPSETLSLTVTDRAGTSSSESGVVLEYSSSKTHQIAKQAEAEYEEKQRKLRAKDEAKRAAASSRL